MPRTRLTAKSPSPRVLLPLLFLCALAVASPARADGDYATGAVQIELQPGVDVGALNAAYGTATIDSLPPLYLLRIPDGMEEAVLETLLSDPSVVDGELAWNNETPEGVRQMVAGAIGGTIDDYLDQNLVERIHLAEIQAHTRGAGVLVAVIDTGVLAGHPALEGALVEGWDFVDNDSDPADLAAGIDEDGDGLVDEGAGHGTMVAGIIRLVAPDALILPIRVLDDEGTGSTWNVAKAIRYAVEHGADVVNLSLGLDSRSMILRRELQAASESASIPVIAAAGNTGQEDASFYPAADPTVLAVAALDSSDVKADFSNWNPVVMVSAPGVGVMAPYYDGAYAIGAGTSFAAPFIAAQCALILSVAPGLDAPGVYAVARQGVYGIYDIPENDPYHQKLGSGRFDGALTWAAMPGTSGLSEDTAPEAAAGTLAVAPNPARCGDGLRIAFAGTSAEGGRIAILDAQGRIVRVLAVHGTTAAWDGIDAAGRPAPAGAYFARVEDTAGLRPTTRFILLAR